MLLALPNAFAPKRCVAGGRAWYFLAADSWALTGMAISEPQEKLVFTMQLYYWDRAAKTSFATGIAENTFGQPA